MFDRDSLTVSVIKYLASLVSVSHFDSKFQFLTISCQKTKKNISSQPEGLQNIMLFLSIQTEGDMSPYPPYDRRP